MKASVAFGDGLAVRLAIGGAGPIEFGLREGMNEAGLGRVIVTVAGRAVLAVEATGKPGEIQVRSLLGEVKKEEPQEARKAQGKRGARGKKTQAGAPAPHSAAKRKGRR
jgi:hypothetical protein